MDLSQEVRKLLTSNTTIKSIAVDQNPTEIVFTAPSPGTYDQQWFWDSCLHSLVWLKLGEKDRAFKELLSLYIGKQQKKLFPHMIFWDYKKTNLIWLLFDRLYPTNKYSELIQPPIIGYPLLQLHDEGYEFSKQLIKETLEYYQHLPKCRDPEKTGLLTIVHPWESGLDSSPKFDLELNSTRMFRTKQWMRMRYLLKEFSKYDWNQKTMAEKSSFRVKCVLTNTLFAWGLESFIALLRNYNFKDETEELESLLKTTLLGLIDNCWNEKDGLFYDLNMNKNNGSQIKISTISSLMPLMLNIPNDMKNRLISHLTNKDEFWTKFPIPTVSLSERSFNPNNQYLLWRGPTWVNTNYFIWLGLNKHKELKLADEISSKTRQLVEISGFREFYNPLTGEGEGAKNFGWSTLISLMK